MTFRFAIHNHIQTLLHCLDAQLLQQNQAYFGGGTVLAMDLGEYRQSRDVDFLCPIATSGYRQLRTVIFERGHEALFRTLQPLTLGRCTTDQYGIRLRVDVAGQPIKLEIIAEARCVFDSPRSVGWSPVACLSWSDCFTSKLLANSDRYMDDGVQSRDLIDLAMLTVHHSLPEVAIAKAEKAYEVIRPLRVAIERFQARPDYRDRCYEGLQIRDVVIPRVVDGLDLLAERLELAPMVRQFREQEDGLG
ncbi:MAG: nucleotidyl transferase AbiEii/AbiGii toxin family protein [Spirulina sp. SIO3F2]|nr:nucleotidyl transferase AbiEii/AbiGii toxin family protein [Spirulina sp. SIO3F2]